MAKLKGSSSLDPEFIKRLCVPMRANRKNKCICLSLILISLVLLFLTHATHQGLSPMIPFEYRYDESVPNTGQHLFGQLSYNETRINENVKETCSPAHNIAFVKTHKTGSSTVANILMRYGIVNNLNFALPNTRWDSPGFNYISRAGEVMSRKYVYPLPEGEEYNILFNHAIYNRTAFRMIMPDDTAYITILRQPFQQFVSTFEYYHVDEFVCHVDPSLINATNRISPFLAYPEKFLGNTTLFSYNKNKQAEDLGFGKDQYFSSTSLLNYISLIEVDFKLVMILEYFDESLLLLKHELCWSMKDILYIRINVNQKKQVRNFTDADHENHRRMSHLDYALYNHFHTVFTEKLKAQSPDFFREVSYFQAVLSDVKDSCDTGKTLNVSGTQWNKPFVVDSHQCDLLRMSVISGLNLLYTRVGRADNSSLEPVIHHRIDIII